MDIASQSKPKRSRLRQVFRLPSLGVALAISLATLVAFAVWIFLDFSFLITLGVVRMDLGLVDRMGVDTARFHAWDELGTRLTLFGALALLAFFGTATSCYRLLFGPSRARSLRSILTVTALFGAWLTLMLSYFELYTAGDQWRLYRTLHRLKHPAATLIEKWPKGDGILPFLGPYSVDSEDPDRIFIEAAAASYPVNPLPGPFVARTTDGALEFDYVAGRLEYHPNGTKPVACKEATRNSGKSGAVEIEHCVELQPNWFLVPYDDFPDNIDN
jgi:hypothetical protein